MAEKAVGRTREAVDAAVLAPAIGVDRAIERDVRAIVAGDDRSRRVVENRRLKRVEVAQTLPTVVEGLAPLFFEPPRMVGASAAAAPAVVIYEAAGRRLDRRFVSLLLAHDPAIRQNRPHT